MTAALWKAVGPDYRTRNGVLWQVGTEVRHPTSTEIVPGKAATYLSVSTEPAETLIGRGIPARLLTVEPLGDVVGDDCYPHKRCGLGFRVLAEHPAWKVLGPNGRQVAAYVECTWGES